MIPRTPEAPDRVRPRVALVAWDLGDPDSAANVFTHVILRGHRRFDFTVVSRTLDPELRALVDWRRAPAPSEPLRLRWAAFYLTAAVRLNRCTTDVVHTWGPAPVVPNRVDLASVNMCQAGYHEASGGRPPGGGPGWRQARAFKLALERWSYVNRASLLDVDAERAKQTLERHYGAEVIVTPRVVDTERFRPDPATRSRVRSELGAGDRDVVVLFVGRDWDLKGLDLAIEGLGRARPGDGAPLRLWVAGGSDRRELSALAASAGVSDRVSFLGFRSDVERLYRAADVFLLPTIYEHFSRAAHEAAASELPVVATSVGGIAELLADGRAGIAIERDPGQIAAALERLAADPGLRARMGRQGRGRCVDFTHERSTDRYLALYEELAARRRRESSTSPM